MSNLQLKHKARHIAIVGQSGSGKSSVLCALANDPQYSRVFVFDAEGEFSERIKNCHVTSDITKMLGKSKITCFVPSGQSDSEDFDDFCLFLFEFCQAHKSVVLGIVDESQLYMSARTLPDDLLNALTRGRRYGLDLAYATHQPGMFNFMLRPQTTEIYAMAIADPDAAKWLKGFGFDTDELQELPSLQYRHKKTGSIITKGEVCPVKLKMAPTSES